MPPRDWTLRIRDILEAVEKIQRYTDGMEYSSFSQDDLTVDAVLRNFSVIGEAARHLPESVAEVHPQIPWADIRGMRNVIVHEYFGVSLSIIWETVQQDLPPLVPELKRLLAKHES